MVHGKNRIPYWIDRRLTGLVGPDYDATISFGLPFEPEDSQYGEYRMKNIALPPLPPSHQHAWGTSALTDGPVLSCAFAWCAPSRRSETSIVSRSFLVFRHHHRDHTRLSL